jgi:CHRD domain-containing protein
MRKDRRGASQLCWAAVIVLTMARPTAAQQVVLQGSGSGAFDVPPANNAAVAFAQCTFDRGAQTISCSSRVYNVVDLTAAHIHIGAPGTSGPVVIPIPNLPLHISGSWGQSWTWSSADFAPTAGNAGVGLTSLDDLINSCVAGGCYLNWHTTASPGGALRVNLCPVNRAANTINNVAVCTQVGQ